MFGVMPRRKEVFMKKVTNFIVDHRHSILVLFILLSGVCLFLSTKVHINDDLTKYLPKSSETRMGNDIMESEFDPIKSSSLNIMFEDLKEEEKQERLKELESIKNVSSVSYDESDAYNKDQYTLYIVNVEDTSDSAHAQEVYKTLEDKYAHEKVVFSGSIKEASGEVLNPWIVALAIASAMVILIIMCDSYIEPFLFLFTIGLGVFLNKGTNLLFPSVSNITDSITAILQMALSMDYSIMLMNRYMQEKEKETDNVKAMKNALYNAFLSISSSSITTIVGLLALVFMSFTIGRDLGYVLAKGVLFSLICIFFCLPGLILLFDKWIMKTQKKHKMKMNLHLLGKFSFHMRKVMVVFFLFLFVGSFLLKGNLTILYTGNEQDEIAQIFEETNQIAVVYDNKYEDEIANFCRKLKDNEKVDALCYGNTLNDSLTYREINEKLKDLNVDTEIEDDLLKIIYYHYYEKKGTKLTLNEFVQFIKNEVKDNKDLNVDFDKEMENSIELLENFSIKKNVNKKRSKKELASLFSLDEKTITNLFVYYHKEGITSKLTLSQFVQFLDDVVLKDKTYASLIDKDTKAQIKVLKEMTNKKTINKKMTSEEMGNWLGIENNTMKDVYLLYQMITPSTNTYTLNEFIYQVYVLNENTDYLKGQNLDAILALYPFAINKNNINDTKLSKEQLKHTFNATLVDTVYQAAGLPDALSFTPKEFVTLVLEQFSPYLKEEEKASLQLLKSILYEDDTKYSASELATLLSIPKKNIETLYSLIGASQSESKLSPYELVCFLNENMKREELSNALNQEMKETLPLMKTVMTSVNQNTKYKASSLAKLLGMEKEDLELLYSLYDISVKKIEIKISIDDFVDFLVEDVMKDKKFASLFDKETKKKVQSVQKIVNGTIKNEKYSASSLYALLSNVSDDLERTIVDLVYIYFGSQEKYNDKWSLTIEELVLFLKDDVLKDKMFDDFIDSELKEKIEDASTLVDDAKEMLVSPKYSRMILNTKYPMESKETFDFIENVKSELASEGKEIYVIGDSPMALEMSKSFDDELNFITILTMIFIFVVVAITFKSALVPLLLVLIIQCAVFFTMGILSLMGGSVYFIALLIVQAILMGATIDYAIVYTSYYQEYRKKRDIKDALIEAYNHSIHTILTSSSVLIIVTLIVGRFASAIAAKICMTISEGTMCAVFLILFVLPALLALFDKFVYKERQKK